MSREITPDQDFQSLEIGRAVHEIHYKRMLKEVLFEGMKLDILRKEKMIVCEIKTSSKFLQAAKFQLLYYLYRLEQMGIKICGEIRIPRERKKILVSLSEKDKEELMRILKNIKWIIDLEKPPELERIPFCRNCAYKEFCWV